MGVSGLSEAMLNMQKNKNCRGTAIICSRSGGYLEQLYEFQDL